MNKAPWITDRKIRLTGTTPSDLNNILSNLPGILGIEQASTKYWIVRYDVRTIQFATIASALKPYLPANWFWRWRTGWFNFEDVNNRDNLLSKGGACCNKPPRRS